METNLLNQEFLYRQTPVDYNSRASLDSIKGNTIVFNQLVRNGNFVDSSAWVNATSVVSMSFNNNIATIVAPSTATNNTFINNTLLDYVQGHKYYYSFDIMFDNLTSSMYATMQLYKTGGSVTDNYREIATGWNRCSAIFNTDTLAVSQPLIRVGARNSSPTEQWTYYLKNIQYFDLTLMFGAGNEPTKDEVEQWLSSHIGTLDYYDYTQGTLIPFNATGLKSVGKNLCPYANLSSVSTSAFTLPSGSYTFSFRLQGTARYSTSTIAIRPSDLSLSSLASINVRGKNIGDILQKTFNLDKATEVFIRQSNVIAGDSGYVCDNIQVEFGNQVTTYEAYTENTLSLPISTYFPTGMKNAGSVYDELTPSKATTRTLMVDLGSLTYTYNSTYQRFTTTIDDIKAIGTRGLQIITPIYECKYHYEDFDSSWNMVIYNGGSTTIFIHNHNYTDATTFKNAMSGVYLVAERNNYIETTINPPLDLSCLSFKDGTEQILPVNTSTPSTAPIIADMTYSAYEVNVSVNPVGSGTITGQTGIVPKGTSVSLHAIANNGYRFTNWLLKGYTQLEYIESTGTQYIDSGFIPTSTMRVEAKIKTISTTVYTWQFGAYDDTNGTKAFGVQIRNTTNALFYGSNNELTYSRNDYTILDVSSGNIVIDGTTKTYNFGTMPSLSLVLFGLNYDGSKSAQTSMQLCYFKIYDNGTLVRNFIPVIRHSDNEVGLLDLVNLKFYGNQGTGEFIAGNPV